MTVEVHNEKDQKKRVCLVFTEPYDFEGKKQIGLVIIGNIFQAVVNQIEKDLTAGIAVGHFEIVCQIQQAKKDPQGLYIKSFTYQEYAFAYKEVIQFGAGISVALYQQKSLRKKVKETANKESIFWFEKANKKLALAKEEEYSGTPVISFWEKEPESINWIVPSEAVKIWQHTIMVSNTEAEKLVEKLYEATQKGKKLKKIEEEIRQLL